MATAGCSRRSARSGWPRTAQPASRQSRADAYGRAESPNSQYTGKRGIGHAQTEIYSERRTARDGALHGGLRHPPGGDRPLLGTALGQTLRRHFREELDRAAPEANARVAQSLYQQATAGKKTAAAIFWLKVRAGWREPATGVPPLVEAPPFVVRIQER